MEKYMYYAGFIATTLLIAKLTIDLRKEFLTAKLRHTLNVRQDDNE